MPKHFYTLLIIPHKKKDSVKKFLATPRHFRLATAVSAVLFFFLGYCAVDYLTIKLEQWELANLRQLTSTQQEQIDTLQEKVSFFERKLAELKQVDEKIRAMASEVTGKSRKQTKDQAAASREQLLGVGGPMPAGEAGADKLTNLNRHMDRLLEDAAARERSLAELQEFLRAQRSIAAVTPSTWPVTGWVTSEFGPRTNPFGSRREFHTGIDIATKLGAPIQAPADGIVTSVEKRPDLGLLIQIEHGRGISTLYAHLFRAAVSKGQVVRRGEVIGYVGNSGRSTGAHLHYSVSLNGVYVNPRKYLR
ncbi:MAG: peptidoglycan DD-metalloendopeptidase family protein [Syntrophaceae bacterium]|nr:peptidoglycan DD-metalloendopeptidase family protein [Syntrophaceae bacterium]